MASIRESNHHLATLCSRAVKGDMVVCSELKLDDLDLTPETSINVGEMSLQANYLAALHQGLAAQKLGITSLEMTCRQMMTYIKYVAKLSKVKLTHDPCATDVAEIMKSLLDKEKVRFQLDREVAEKVHEDEKGKVGSNPNPKHDDWAKEPDVTEERREDQDAEDEEVAKEPKTIRGRGRQQC